MKLYGKLVKDTFIIREATIESQSPEKSFRDQLEECFVTLCRELDIQVPLWLKKNTTEFARYRKTFFPPDHFFEKVMFDKFELKIEDI